MDLNIFAVPTSDLYDEKILYFSTNASYLPLPGRISVYADFTATPRIREIANLIVFILYSS